MMVLIVDDEELIASSLQVFLQDEGLKAIAVGSGEAALQAVRAEPDVGVCIMDLRLPGMDGNATIRAISDLRPDMKYLVHTGSVNYAVPTDLKAMGIKEEHLFRKPLTDMSVIAQAIRLFRDQMP